MTTTGSVFSNGPTSSSPCSDIGTADAITELDPHTYYPIKGGYANGRTHKLPSQMNRQDRRAVLAARPSVA